jgi:AcrR family transcriptional regulator
VNFIFLQFLKKKAVKGENTRNLIIDVATELFAINGVRATTMEAIATAAGRGRRTVYMYFRDKAEIYNVVVEREILHICKALKEIMTNDGDPSEVLREYAIERYNFINSLLRRNPLLVRDFVQCHNRIERLRERLNKEELKTVIPWFKKALKSGKVKSDKPAEILAVTFMNMLRGNDRVLTLKENRDQALERINAACDIFIRGALE